MNIKKALGVALSAASVVPAFAQEGSITVDTGNAEDAVGAIGTAISDLLSGSVMTNILLIVGAGLAIACVFMAVRWLLRGGKAAAK